MDARQGKTSLGANLTGIKDSIDQNKVQYTSYVDSVKLPTYGVDYMTYKQRRDRILNTALEHQYVGLVTPNYLLEGRNARREGASANMTADVIYTAPVATVEPYIAFDYYAEDVNFERLRIDFRTDASNIFRWELTSANITIKQGLNNIILNKKSVTHKIGNPDWSNITVVLAQAKANANGTHIFQISEMDNYKYKPVVTLWFDDCHHTVFNNAKPTLDLYNFKCVQSVVGKWIGQPYYQNTSQLAQMVREGHEHCNHTYSHVGFSVLTGIQADITLQRGLDYCLAHNFGKASYFLVNPQGESTAVTLPYERKYATLRRVGLGKNYFPIVDMFNIKTSIEPLWATPATDVQLRIDEAIETGEWLVILLHYIRADDQPGDYTYPQSQFNAICAYLNAKQIAGELEVLTASEAILKI